MQPARQLRAWPRHGQHRQRLRCRVRGDAGPAHPQRGGYVMRELTVVLRRLGNVAVAVSGGVDSTTLAVVAHRDPAVRAEMFHAVSPAVPPEATERVRRYAASEGWDLRVIDA